MSPQWIEVDEEVMAKVQGQAEPFVDSPNDALRALLGLEPASEKACAPLPATGPTHRRSRASAGELLSIAEYEFPLLRALSQLGGSAPSSRVKEAVEPLLIEKLTDLDRERLQSGEVRWENRLGFARLRAIHQGHMRSNSRRGIWELTEAGIERLGQLEAEAQEREREGAK
jgi:hypothetical protein